MPAQPRSRPTSADVAAASGVSRATVSYVLNDTPGHSIPDATRARVLAAVEELGYVANPLARALKRGGTQIVLFDLHGWTPGVALTRYVAALDDLLAERGYALLVHHGASTPAQLRRVAIQVAARAVSSLRELPRREVELMEAAGIRVLGGTDATEPRLTHEHLQVAHLAERGHRVIAYARPDDVTVDAFVRQRRRRTARAALGHGMQMVTELTVTDDPEANAAALTGLLALHPSVTAVAAYNDDTALSVLAAARDTQVAVPARLAVIGIDDAPLGRLWDPPLTTLAIDYRRSARMTADAILGGPDDTDPSGMYALIVRSST